MAAKSFSFSFSSSSSNAWRSRTRTRTITRTTRAFLGSLVLFAVFAVGAAAAERIRVINPGGPASTASAPQANEAPRTEEPALRWRNGETAKGDLLDATADEVRWKSPLFDSPLVLGWPAVRRIDHALPSVAPADPFHIALRDGSSLHGDVVAVGGESITIRSARCGEAVLKRAEVLSVRRLRGGDLVLAGPGGDAEWRLVEPEKKTNSAVPGLNALGALNRGNAPATEGPALSALKTGPGGALLLPYWNRSVTREVTFPERVDVEFRVRSSVRPDFRFALEPDTIEQLRIETWDTELVLAAGDAFQTIRKMADDERETALRVCWDRKARKCSVFTPEGKWIVDWTVPTISGAASSRVSLTGKGRDLSLEFLRVRAWNGQPPAKLAGRLPRVELADGRILEGEIGGGESGFISVRADAAAGPATRPLSEVEALVFSSDRPQLTEAGMQLTFADGMLLRGRVTGLKGGQATLDATFAEKPLTVSTGGLRQWLVEPAKPDAPLAEAPLEENDTIAIQGTRLHGKFSGAADGAARWLPMGGAAPATLAKNAAYEITRAIPPGAAPPAAASLFFLAGGDVLPGYLRSLDRAGVEIDGGIFETKRLPGSGLDAIVFAAASSAGMKGFGDGGWQILRGDTSSVQRTDEKVTMQPGTALGHSSLMQYSEIGFTLSCNEGFGGVRVRLFSSGEDRKDTTSVIVANMGSRIYCGVEEREGETDDDLQQTGGTSGAAVKVVLAIDERRVELRINDVAVRSVAIPAARRKGLGIVIKPASIFGNGERSITLADFSTRGTPGNVAMPAVNTEARSQALTIPRFRRDDPPLHALLAMNGDVLRGEIEAITATHFGFRAGLENLRVPRDRVKAAIWLKKPTGTAAPMAAGSRANDALEQMLTRRVRYSGMGLDSLIGVLQREAPQLKFKLSAAGDARKLSMQFGGQTVGKALDEICALFGLRHRIDAEGAIVIESGPAPAKDFVERVYWLKPAALPSGGSAQEILLAKGVPFPPRSGAAWQPESGQLTVTNSAANHGKLAAVLAAEFGGTLGSPTHWLSLANGGRFGLAVERFGADEIVGSHPLYGRCRVPLEQVCVIRTTPPQTTAAAKALGDWQLVFAPEPVLPESGGENSPAVGKAAKTFKAPLLGGGEFQLASEKGKVVVLDFWATWCGPCIKSLPALIDAMAALPAERVKLIGVNQGEPAEQVKRFLETRGWKLTVALDAGQNVARQYGVEGIPHTVVIGPDGTVAWAKTGYSPDGAKETADAVKQLLAAPAAK